MVYSKSMVGRRTLEGCSADAQNTGMPTPEMTMLMLLSPFRKASWTKDVRFNVKILYWLFEVTESMSPGSQWPRSVPTPSAPDLFQFVPVSLTLCVAFASSKSVNNRAGYRAVSPASNCEIFWHLSSRVASLTIAVEGRTPLAFNVKGMFARIRALVKIG